MGVIVTLTINPAVDVSSSVDHVVPERKLRCQPPRREPGGGGINVSRAIRRLGGDSLAIYTRGGPTGSLLQTLLDQEGLTQRAIGVDGTTRESFVVFEEVSGLQYRFNMPGPTLQAAEWQRCLDELTHCEPRPEHIVASGSLPPGVPEDFYARVACIGRQRGGHVIVDTSGPALGAAARAGVYLLKPNLRELDQLTGQRSEDESQREAAVMALIEAGQAEVVVVSLGAAGVLLGSRQGCERLRSPIVPIQSKIGAGDSLVAGIVLSLARGESVRDAVRFGIAAGAAAVMTPGTELCRAADTERLYRQMSD
jgi:6-phosphofructokinase 2